MSEPYSREQQPPPVPLIVLTGFLGAGKTTLLNRVLEAQHHRKVAVLVNELGRIDIDAGLIRGRAGDVLELTGGCVCHQIGVQRELWSALEDIVTRSRPDVVVLETTGIAEPAAIWEGLADLRREHEREQEEHEEQEEQQEEQGGRRRYDRAEIDKPSLMLEAAATVTVVDAEAGERQLERHGEARAQVEAADRILITKLELATPAALAGLHARLFELNPRAERVAFPPGPAGTAALVPWLLDTRPSAVADRPGRAAPSHQHGHEHQLAAATFVDDAPLIAPALLLVCRTLGDRLVRAKGYVHLAGETRRGVLERAGDRLHLELGEPWGNECPTTRLVLIGDDLDEAALYRQLWACRAPTRPTH